MDSALVGTRIARPTRMCRKSDDAIALTLSRGAIAPKTARANVAGCQRRVAVTTIRPAAGRCDVDVVRQLVDDHQAPACGRQHVRRTPFCARGRASLRGLAGQRDDHGLVGCERTHSR